MLEHCTDYMKPEANRIKAAHRAAFAARFLGVLLIGLGVAAVFASPSAQYCDADYDAVTCYLDGTGIVLVAGISLICVGVIALRSPRIHPAGVLASASIAVVALTVAVLVLANPRNGTTCDTHYYAPLLGPGETPMPVPTPNEDGLYCVDSLL